MSPRHFLTLDDVSGDELRRLIQRATELARDQRAGIRYAPLVGRVLAMIFEKSSTRTRLSFEAGMSQLGGDSIFLSPRDTQLGRGEPIEDTARVVGRMCDAVMIRTGDHDTLERFAEHARAPVINGLTDRCHPCQLLADVQTYTELRGDIAGRTVAWIGDGNNMCRSWLNAARLLGFTVRVACPDGFGPGDEALKSAGAAAVTVDDPQAAADGADLVVTDVWASMGQEAEQDARTAAFSAYQVDAALMAHAADDALFMHCLPAHRGEEVTAEVLEGPHSVVWQEAENRLHAQKALLEMLVPATQ
ncbi:MAG: ornithine carbamoyltransferase [Proteobacteria bacterium SW_6_67_9]|nr:MAG: ornithine carbamoyltransferase [Proteobacteria bacterium SW_6_67_9]